MQWIGLILLHDIANKSYIMISNYHDCIASSIIFVYMIPSFFSVEPSTDSIILISSVIFTQNTIQFYSTSFYYIIFYSMIENFEINLNQ